MKTISRVVLVRCAGVLVVAGISGCARGPASFRLVAPASPVAGSAVTLVPPGAKDAANVSAIVPIPRVSRKLVCPPSPHGLTVQKGSRIVVTRAALTATPPRELYDWAVALEKQGCLPPNTAFRTAEDIVDSVPLDVTTRLDLIRSRADLRSVNSLNVISPVGAPTAAAELTAVRQGANPSSIDVDAKASPGVIGYEIDWYDVQPKDSGPGYRLIPRSAEVHIGSRVEHPAAPTTPRFQFATDASWYQLNMMTKVSANDYDFVLFSGRTSAELQERDADFQKDATAFLKNVDPASYTALPHGTGINAFIKVTVNGALLDLPRANTVSQAIAATRGDPRTVLPHLKVRRLHDGKLFPVEWDRAGDRILSLSLEGGEEISF